MEELQQSYVTFDRDVHGLQHKKLHLDNCIKQAEFRYITTYEEYLLLKDFETREKSLTQRLEVRMRDNQEMAIKVRLKTETLPLVVSKVFLTHVISIARSKLRILLNILYLSCAVAFEWTCHVLCSL